MEPSSFTCPGSKEPIFGEESIDSISASFNEFEETASLFWEDVVSARLEAEGFINKTHPRARQGISIRIMRRKERWSLGEFIAIRSLSACSREFARAMGEKFHAGFGVVESPVGRPRFYAEDECCFA